MMLRCPAVRLSDSAVPGLCLGLFLALALTACSGPGPSPFPPPAPRAGAQEPAAAPAEAPAALQTRATLSRVLTDEGRSLRVEVDDLRPGERVVSIVLEGPDGSRVAAGPGEILTGSRASGAGTSKPRMRLEGGNNERMGVTFSMDLFSTRPKGEAPRESALAWAFLPLPDPAAYAAAPGSWTVHVTLQDEVGNSLEISD